MRADRALMKMKTKMKWMGLLALAVPAVGHAQIRSTLKPATATQLRPGELIRYYKVRPTEQVDGLPYQVLIIVTTQQVTVKTNRWELTEKLTDAQKEGLKVTLSYQAAKDFHRPYVAPEEPIDPSFQIDRYLAFRRKGATITWNSIKYAQPQLPSIFDFLDVQQYLARRTKEPEQFAE